MVEAGEEEELPDQRDVVAYQAVAKVERRVQLGAEEEAFLWVAVGVAYQAACLGVAYQVVCLGVAYPVACLGVAYPVACREGVVAYHCQEDNALEAVEGVVVHGVAV